MRSESTDSTARPWAKRAAKVLRELLTLIWPTECVACGEPDSDLCRSCEAQLHAENSPSDVDIGVPVFVRARYEAVFRAVLVAFKHEGRYVCAPVLARELRWPLRAALDRAAAVPTFGDVKRSGVAAVAPPLLVPVPSRPAGVRRRGYRHVDVLVRLAMRDMGASKSCGRAKVARVLRTTAGRRGQVGLRHAERARNAARIAVRNRQKIAGRRVIVIDDIVTTGATVRAACEALERSGAVVVAVVALCATVRQDRIGRSDASLV